MTWKRSKTVLLMCMIVILNNTYKNAVSETNTAGL
jgi:hypothetical protein